MNKSVKRPLILVTNDDGIGAKGIKVLVEIMSRIGQVIVVAPDKPNSGMSHAITIHTPLRVKRVNTFVNIEAYTCSGTPVDCVKIALNKLFKKKPDICVSGINHGSNASINVIYSGTVSAAREAAIHGIPSIGFSMCSYDDEAYFDSFREFVPAIVHRLLRTSISNLLLNVNAPNISIEKIKGFRICRQARASWKEAFDERKDPMGYSYYWLTGQFENKDDQADTDQWALENGYVSIVPVLCDITAYDVIEKIKKNNDWNISLPSLS